MKEKQVKKKGMAGKIIRTVLSLLLVIVMVILMVAANTALRSNDRMVNSILGDVGKTIDNSGAQTEGLDLEYNKSDYTAEEITAAEDDLKQRISEEGLVLLKNDGRYLPLSSDTTFSFFSANSAKLSIGGGMLGG